MSKESRFIRLVWTCPNCQARNPGPQHTCLQCGAPQPPDVQFELPSEAEVVTEAAELEAAQRGPDIHCGYCGARNPASAEQCSQCGADLSEGRARQAGGILTPTEEAARQCPACGYENRADARYCRQCGSPLGEAKVTPATPAVTPVTPRPQRRLHWGWIAAALALFLACCLGIAALFLTPTANVVGEVSHVAWQTEVTVEKLQAVRHVDEAGSPPGNAYDVSCHNETRQVCEEKTIDRGNGYAEVVQECHDETTQICSYTLDEWKTVQTLTLEGQDFSPTYAQPSLGTNQRLGKSDVTFSVYLRTPRGELVYRPSGLSEYQQFQAGSRWRVYLNALGGVVKVESLP